jgi:hypothetical protein
MLILISILTHPAPDPASPQTGKATTSVSPQNATAGSTVEERRFSAALDPTKKGTRLQPLGRRTPLSSLHIRRYRSEQIVDKHKKTRRL